MTAVAWAALIPSVAALLTALAAYLNSRATSRSVQMHVQASYLRNVTVPQAPAPADSNHTKPQQGEN